MADLVLVQPRVAFMEGLKERPAIPLGLLSACRLLPEGREVAVIDARVEPDWEARLRREVARGPLCVGVTAVSGGELLSALDASRAAKEEGGAPVVWGGPHPTALPDQTLAHPLVDGVVRGEGEATMPELLDALEGGEPSAVPGVSWKVQGRRVHAPDRPPVDMGSLPPVPYRLVDMDAYLPRFRGRCSVIFEGSRGCPSRCAFCYNGPVFGGRYRAMPAGRVVHDVAELAALYPRVRAVEFVDMNLSADVRRMLDVFRGLLEADLGLEYLAAGVRADAVGSMRDEELRLLERAGVRGLLFGVESGSQRVLDAVGKGVSVEQVLCLNRRLAGRGLGASYNFMLGFVGESAGDRRATLALALRLLDDNPEATTSCFNPVAVYPRTRMLELALASGFAEPSCLEGWGEYLRSASSIVAGMSWLSHRDRLEVERAYVASSFLADTSNLIDSPALRSLARLYRPVARWRLGRGAFGLMPEAWAYRAARRWMGG